jgi:hypothetical protein
MNRSIEFYLRKNYGEVNTWRESSAKRQTEEFALEQAVLVPQGSLPRSINKRKRARRAVVVLVPRDGLG